MKNIGLLENKRPTIAVTGSAGKTTTKSMIASILKRRWAIFESIDFNNTYVNTQKHAKSLNDSHQAVVVEFGIDSYGHITKHCSWINPNIGVITNIGTAHIGNFGGSVEKLAGAKSELIQQMDQNGVLLINGDDDNSKHLLIDSFIGTLIKVGINQPADYCAEEVKYTEGGMSFSVRLRGNHIPLFIPIYGVHNIYNALFAIAIGDILDFSPEDISEGLREYNRPIMRLSISNLHGDLTLIDDSYSANLNAMKAALDVLANVGKGTKVAVLGSMAGLGVISKEAHRELGTYALKKKIDFIYTFGEKARLITKVALEQGMSEERAIHFEQKEDMYQVLKNLPEETTILVKGSRKFQMEEVVHYLIDRYGNREL